MPGTHDTVTLIAFFYSKADQQVSEPLHVFVMED